MQRKQTLLFVLLLLLETTLAAQIMIPDFVFSYAEDTVYFVGYHNHLYECDTYAKKFRDITSDLSVDSYGYLHLKYRTSTISYPTIHEGDNVLLLSPVQFFYLGDKERISTLRNTRPGFGFEDLGILELNTTSYISEQSSGKTITYDVTNLLERFFTTDQEFRYEIWPNCLPFAVKKEQLNGCTINIEFSEKTNTILLLNGFVDLYRPYLYKQNSRIRTLTITGVDAAFEKKYILEDIVQFQKIDFPIPCSKIRITIDDFYYGEKYTDVCLSGIAPVFVLGMKGFDVFHKTNYDLFIKTMFSSFTRIE